MAQHNFLTLLEGQNKYLPVNLDLALQTDLTSGITNLQNQIDGLTGVGGGIYSKDEVNNLLDLKADKLTTYTKTEVNNLLDNKADITYVDGELALKADLTYVDAQLLTKVNTSDLVNYYTKTEVEGLLTSVYKFKGSVPNLTALYAIDPLPKEGDVYNVVDSGMNYAFLPNKTINEAASWDNLGTIVDLSDYSTTAEVTTAINNALSNYYTKSVSDGRYVQNITINGTSVGVTKTNGIVNLDLTSYLNGATSGIISDISDLEDRVTTIEGDITTIEGNITAIEGRLDTVDSDIEAIENIMVTGAKFNGTDVTKTGRELLFSTVLVDSTSTAMTLTTLNTTHGDKPIGFMLYCTNASLMTKYVKIGANIWSVEPIFLAQ